MCGPVKSALHSYLAAEETQQEHLESLCGWGEKKVTLFSLAAVQTEEILGHCLEVLGLLVLQAFNRSLGIACQLITQPKQLPAVSVFALYVCCWSVFVYLFVCWDIPRHAHKALVCV